MSGEVHAIFSLDNARWNAFQRVYVSSTHSELSSLAWPDRKKKASKKWRQLKLEDTSDQEREYNAILSKYAPKPEHTTALTPLTIETDPSASQTLISTNANHPPGLELSSPPEKRRRIGGPHKQHKTPKITEYRSKVDQLFTGGAGGSEHVIAVAEPDERAHQGVVESKGCDIGRCEGE